jgi:hypothetical protein
MTLVWLFLLGWTRMIEGTFTAIEIAMTIVVGAASVIGLATVFRSRTTISWARGIGLALLFAVLQVVALRISFLPGISRDPW